MSAGRKTPTLPDATQTTLPQPAAESFKNQTSAPFLHGLTIKTEHSATYGPQGISGVRDTPQGISLKTFCWSKKCLRASFFVDAN